MGLVPIRTFEDLAMHTGHDVREVDRALIEMVSKAGSQGVSSDQIGKELGPVHVVRAGWWVAAGRFKLIGGGPNAPRPPGTKEPPYILALNDTWTVRHDIEEMKMPDATNTDEQVIVPYDLALKMLPNTPRIHTYMNGPGLMLGADWDRCAVLELIGKHGCELSGPMATGMMHGLVCMEPTENGPRPVFLETARTYEEIQDGATNPNDQQLHGAGGGAA